MTPYSRLTDEQMSSLLKVLLQQKSSLALTGECSLTVIIKKTLHEKTILELHSGYQKAN